MTVETFDTLQASKDLQSHGFEQEQAEAIAQVVRNGQGELATKNDIASIRSDINSLRWMMGINFIIMIGGFSLLANSN